MADESGAKGLARMSWGVSALLIAASDALVARLGSVTVRGELSGLSKAGSGHWYFALKDSDGAAALLRCAMFRRATALVDFAAADGQQVELRGRLAIYEARGELQMVVESLQRLGAGTLYEEFLRRRARLEAEGLFDASRKRALPAWPSALGIVTSLAAAALRDVVITLARRAPQVRIVIYPAPVQGADAPQALVEALRVAGQRNEVDALLLVRGGGSLEDLWAFNDDRLVRAVAACPLPIVCGVGHETDITLCDLAADLRAPTPTAAAELAAPARDDALLALRSQQLALQRVIERGLQARAQQLDNLALRLGQPGRGVAGQNDRLQALARRIALAWRQRHERATLELPQLAARLQRSVAVQLKQQQLRLAGVALGLQAQDPKRVLQRGYAWIESAPGRPVTSARELGVGQTVRALWADGRADAVVTAVELPAA